MNQHEFRGKEVENGNWVYGCLAEKCFILPFRKKIYLNKYDYKTNTFEIKEWIRIVPETVGKFTKLKDKNGIKIYKNDIVKMIATLKEYNLDSLGYEQEEEIKVEYIGVVKVWASMGVVMKVFIRDGKLLSNKENNIKNIRTYRSEKIGNIFDNPELLEGEK